MILFKFLLLVGSLKGQEIIDREAMRTKLLDAQNVMGFDQVEFDRLWDIAMSYGRFSFYFQTDQKIFYRGVAH